MRGTHRRYRRIDENALVVRLPLPNDALCQNCGSSKNLVRHHTSDESGIISVWVVCSHCNCMLKQESLKVSPIFTVYGFYNKTPRCAVCGKKRKLDKHHYFEAKKVFVLRVCHLCNMNLPSYGIKETQRAILDIRYKNSFLKQLIILYNHLRAFIGI